MEANSNESGANSNSKGSTLTIRLIRSFQFQNWKPIVLQNVELESTTTEDLGDLVAQFIKSSTLPPPFKNLVLDAFKIEYQPHGYKSNNPLINTENDDKLTLKPGMSLASQGIQNETEISYFKKAHYLAYLKFIKSK